MNQSSTKSVAPIEGFKVAVESRKASWAAILPKHVSVERFARSIILAAARSPALLNADKASIFLAAQQAAQLGLDCSGTLGSAYLVPYGGKVTLVIGYRGLIDLARRSKEIVSLQAQVVHAADRFEVTLGTEPSIVHVPAFGVDDRGDVTAAYAVAELVGGGRQFEVMTRGQLEAIRRRSKASGSGPWVTDTEEMFRKTVLRRLAKWLPLSPELADAMIAEAAGNDGDASDAAIAAAADVLEVPADNVEKEPTDAK